MMRLRADMAHAAATPRGGGGGQQRAIAECGFSVETGLWTYKMLRPDKVWGWGAAFRVVLCLFVRSMIFGFF